MKAWLVWRDSITGRPSPAIIYREKILDEYDRAHKLCDPIELPDGPNGPPDLAVAIKLYPPPGVTREETAPKVLAGESVPPGAAPPSGT